MPNKCLFALWINIRTETQLSDNCIQTIVTGAMCDLTQAAHLSMHNFSISKMRVIIASNLRVVVIFNEIMQYLVFSTWHMECIQ